MWLGPALLCVAQKTMVMVGDDPKCCACSAPVVKRVAHHRDGSSSAGWRRLLSWGWHHRGWSRTTQWGKRGMPLARCLLLCRAVHETCNRLQSPSDGRAGAPARDRRHRMASERGDACSQSLKRQTMNATAQPLAPHKGSLRQALEPGIRARCLASHMTIKLD